MVRILARPRLFAVVVLWLAAGVLLAQGELVIVKEGTGLYHRPSCDVIRDGKDVLAMSLGQAEARGFKAHEACDPSKAKEPLKGEPAPPSATKSAKPPAPVLVYVDAGGSHYHRLGCKRLGKDPKKVVLDAAAARKYWPCALCKPPIRPRPPKK